MGSAHTCILKELEVSDMTKFNEHVSDMCKKKFSYSFLTIGQNVNMAADGKINCALQRAVNKTKIRN